MSYNLSDKLVIGLSSSALFDLEESDNVFRQNGEEEYRVFQRENQDNTLKKGVAFPFIRRLLSLNKIHSEKPLVEVILLSRNDPDTGLRVMNSIENYGLGITRSVFLQGRSPHKYIPALDIELFLSANSQDVNQAVIAGYPAGLILKGNIKDDDKDHELRIAFDFDGVIADDEAEAIYQKTHQLSDFHYHEKMKVNIAHNPGPLKNFLQKISDIQKLEQKIEEEEPSYKRILRISIVTARNAPSHKRVINTMREWGINVNEAFFMGGIEKRKILEVMKPHIFFDDQKLHLEPSASILPSVHIPFGVINESQNKSK